MTEEQLLRVEDALGVYDRTHVNPSYPDGRDPISRDITMLVAEVRRLRQIIIEYARHNVGCSAAFGDTYRCRCGWRAVEAEFMPKGDEPDDVRDIEVVDDAP